MIRFIAQLIAFLALTSCAHWSYQKTEDKTTILGRSPKALSISVYGTTVRFDIPKAFEVVSCVDQPLDWQYVIYSKKQKFGFYVTLEKGFTDTALSERYQNYLNGIHDVHDPKVEMQPAAPFYLRDGTRIISYRYFSEYWGQRLVVMIPKGVYTTTFEFSASTETELESFRPIIQKVLGSFSYITK